MATHIHPSSVVHPGAELGDDVNIGPFCIVASDTLIGSGTLLESHVVIESGSRIGTNCRIWPGAVIGGPPQDHKYKGERSFLVLGNNNLVRECVTLHRATGEGVATRIGNDNMLMAYVHVGHNCDVGNHNTLSSFVGLSGHVLIESNVILGGMVGVHQFCRIGKLAMIGGCAKVNQDIPPFMLADANPARVIDLNTIGLKRANMTPNTRTLLRQAYKLLYRSNLNTSQALERIEDELEPCEELEYLILFIRGTQAGTMRRGNQTPRA
jgi:UDP-N-acetylglucosamine acyltransferase